MIVAFVIDTSPSMGEPLLKSNSNSTSKQRSGMSRLDLAKMAMESITKKLRNRIQEHNMSVLHQDTLIQSSHPQSLIGVAPNPQGSRFFQSLGFGYCPSDHLLLLSTGRQHTNQPASAACGAGGRLLVGFGPTLESSFDSDSPDHVNQQQQSNSQQEAFDFELKRLKAASYPPSGKNQTFPEESGGAAGLNTALSAGLQLLSR